MSKNDILNELASMGLEAEYRNSISVMLDEFENATVKRTLKDVEVVFKHSIDEYTSILGWLDWINDGGEQ